MQTYPISLTPLNNHAANSGGSESSLLREARELFLLQSSIIADLAEHVGETFTQIVDLILASRGQVVVSGIGKSGLVGQKIAATLASTGTRSFFLHPAEALHGDLGMITPENDVAVLISNSGETEEVLRLIPSLRRLRIPLVGLIGDARSKLWREVDHPLDVSVKREACPHNLAPTNSTLAIAAMGDVLAVSLMRARNFRPIDFARLHPGGSLGRRLLSRVGDLMRTKGLPLLSPRQTVREALPTITRARLGIGVVVSDDDSRRVLGILTDGDLRRAMQMHEHVLDLTVAKIMTSGPITISPEATVEGADERMRSLKLKALLVVNDDGQLLGVLDIFDE